MGAPKPGSTFQPTPAQGGKGGGNPMQPQGTYPGMPLTPNPSSPFYFPNGPEASAQALNQGKGKGVPMGGMLGGGGNPMQPQVMPAQDTYPGMPFQGFNPAGTDADLRRPFVSPNPLQPQMPQRDPRSAIQQVQGMLRGQPQMPQPANPQLGLGKLQTNKFRRRLG